MTFRIHSKPKREKTGIRIESRVSKRHQQWVRTKACVVKGCERRDIQCAHLRSGLPPGELAGTGIKSHDAFCFPCCSAHHREQHAKGEITFQDKYSLDLLAIALTFARASPDEGIRNKARGINA